MRINEIFDVKNDTLSSFMGLAQMLRGRADRDNVSARISISQLSQQLINIGLSVSADEIRHTIESNPSMQNLISDMDDETITFVSDADPSPMSAASTDLDMGDDFESDPTDDDFDDTEFDDEFDDSDDTEPSPRMDSNDVDSDGVNSAQTVKNMASRATQRRR